MLIKQFANRPLYLQLRDALVERLSNGEWKGGAALPNEVDLAREFGVSPDMMRKALDTMEGEHLITRLQGRGTFINDPASDKHSARFSNIRDANGDRITGSAKTGEITQCAASELEIARLQLQPKDQVYRIRRFRYHRERLYMVEDASLPMDLFPGFPEKTGLSDRVVVLSQHYGVLLGRAVERVSISKADPIVADRLNLPTGMPVMMLDRVVFALDGRPVEWRVGYCHLVDEYYSAEVA
jgi:GntR family transcriptional regulator